MRMCARMTCLRVRESCVCACVRVCEHVHACACVRASTYVIACVCRVCVCAHVVCVRLYMCVSVHAQTRALRSRMLDVMECVCACVDGQVGKVLHDMEVEVEHGKREGGNTA